MYRDSNLPPPIRIRLKNEANKDEVFFVTVSCINGLVDDVLSTEGYHKFSFVTDSLIHKMRFEVYNTSGDGHKVINKYLGYFHAELVHTDTKGEVNIVFTDYIEQNNCFAFELVKTSSLDFDVILTRPIS